MRFDYFLLVSIHPSLKASSPSIFLLIFLSIGLGGIFNFASLHAKVFQTGPSLLGVSLYERSYYPSLSLGRQWLFHEISFGKANYSLPENTDSRSPVQETPLLSERSFKELRHGPFWILEGFGRIGEDSQPRSFFSAGIRYSQSFGSDPWGLITKLVSVSLGHTASFKDVGKMFAGEGGEDPVMTQLTVGLSVRLIRHWSWAPLNVGFGYAHHWRTHSLARRVVMHIGFGSFLIPLF